MRVARVLALVTGLTACESRPAAMDSTAALAAPGTTIPPFSFPSTRGTTFDRGRLLLGHTLVALLPGNVTGSEPAVVEFDSLKFRYPMFRSAVVVNRALEPRDTAYVNEPAWLFLSERGFASDSQIVAAFAPGARAASDRDRQAILRLPSFLVVSDSGRVLARVSGRPFAVLRPVMDSLRAVWESVRKVKGDSEVALLRPRIERGVRSFDPASLVASADRFSLEGSCGDEVAVPRGIIPAIATLVDIEARHPGVTTILEITSVAEIAPIDSDDLCESDQVAVTPRVVTRRYVVDFFSNLADSTGIGDLYISGPVEVAGDRTHESRVGLFALAQGRRTFELPPGASMQELRARADSIRAAAR